MINIYIESVWIVSKWVVADKLILNQLTNAHKSSAVHAPEGGILPVPRHNFVNVVELSPVVQRIIVLSDLIHVSCVACDLGYWTKGNKQVNYTCVVILKLRKSVEHLGCALRVGDISHLFNTSQIGYVVQICGYIVLAHLLKVVGPELALVPVRVQRNMGSTVGVTACVA